MCLDAAQQQRYGELAGVKRSKETQANLVAVEMVCERGRKGAAGSWV